MINLFLGVVETRSESGIWTAFFTAITPLVLLFSLWVQRIWASSMSKAATRSADAAEAVKVKLEQSDKDFKASLSILQQTTDHTHLLVNGQRGIILKNLSILARNHAIMARSISHKSRDENDLLIARAAELAATSAENEYEEHRKGEEEMQKQMDAKKVDP